MEDCLPVARIGRTAGPGRIDLAAAERVSASATEAIHAAELYERLGEPLSAATHFAAAADSAACEGRIAVALETAVRALVALGGAVRAGTDAERDLPAEAQLAVRLGALCRRLSDYPRALRFYELALDALRGGPDHCGHALSAMTAVAELLLVQVAELGPDDPERVRLLDRAERMARRLRTTSPSDLYRRVHGPRLLADVLCASGRAAQAWPLLVDVRGAVADLGVDSADLGVAHLAAGRCLLLLDRDGAVAELDRAVELLDEEVSGAPSPAELLMALRLRSAARQSAGDVTGALDDARRLADLVWACHQRHVGGFMDQVWSRAGAEEERRDLEERTEALMASAEQDPLTGLANRRALTRFCGDLLPSGEASFVLIDVDHFKTVNDRFGHGVGDAVLQSLAVLLTRSVRTLDVVARWGGEEFLVALPGASSGMGADAAARICRRVREHSWSELADGLGVTVSAGVASGPVAELDVVLDRADSALYAAKNQGRDRSVVW
jgi:diguanylate cyclase (GGDEF)-like protein